MSNAGRSQITDTVEVFRGKIVSVRLEKVRRPDGAERVFEVVRHPGGAVVVAVDGAGRVCLIRQWRHAAGGWLWELPAGKLDVAGESPGDAASRELAEEAGIVAAKWESLGSVVSSPGFCDEVLHLFLACELRPVETAHEDGEFIEIRWFGMEEALSMAESGEITDAKTIAGLFRASRRLFPCAVGKGEGAC